ncbi:hypothetical protein [Carboxylicivirga caseinilyticus]
MFRPEDLKEVVDQVGDDSVICVLERHTVEEAEWLLSLKADHDF